MAVPRAMLVGSNRVSARPMSVGRRGVIVLCFLLSMLDGADLLVMSFVAPVLASEWAIRPEKLGVIFSASLAGMAAGCLLLAPLADRYGRRPTVTFALMLTTASMLASSQVGSVGAMMLARFLVGLGVGTIGVTMTALAAENASPRNTTFVVGFVQAGWPLGSILTAFGTAALLPQSGWRAVLLTIGCVSMILLVIVLVALPESSDFLSRSVSASRVRTPRSVDNAVDARLKARRSGVAAWAWGSLAAPFADGRGRAGLVLWLAVTLGYFVLYFVISWIPKLAMQAGLPLDHAIFAGAAFNLGAFVGTAAVGALAVRMRLSRVIAGFFFAAAIALLVFGNAPLPLALVLGAAMLVGVTVQGGFNGFWALAANFYPPETRGAGIGWALGAGRIGAVLGPVVGGLLVGAGASVGAIFIIFAIPALAAGMLCLHPALSERRR